HRLIHRTIDELRELKCLHRCLCSALAEWLFRDARINLRFFAGELLSLDASCRAPDFTSPGDGIPCSNPCSSHSRYWTSISPSSPSALLLDIQLSRTGRLEGGCSITGRQLSWMSNSDRRIWHTRRRIRLTGRPAV